MGAIRRTFDLNIIYFYLIIIIFISLSYLFSLYFCFYIFLSVRRSSFVLLSHLESVSSLLLLSLEIYLCIYTYHKRVHLLWSLANIYIYIVYYNIKYNKRTKSKFV